MTTADPLDKKRGRLVEGQGDEIYGLIRTSAFSREGELRRTARAKNGTAALHADRGEHDG